jgi:hypothetical protein
MNRYSNFAKTIYKTPGESNNIAPGYINIKYPEISLDFSDIYVYVSRGDRYDTLAQQYYEDSTMWWIISRANKSQTPDSLIPEIGSQIRIPGRNRTQIIMSQYNELNNLQKFSAAPSSPGSY